MGEKKTEKDGAEAEKNRREAQKRALAQIAAVIQDNMHLFVDLEDAQDDNTGRQNQRFLGLGTKNYGFMELATELARDNPRFVPPFIDVDEMQGEWDDVREMNQIVLLLTQFRRSVRGKMLRRADAYYRTDLYFYNSLKEQARGRISGAADLFNMMRPYFERSKRNKGGELTEKQIEKDAKKLIKGKAEGEVAIRNEMPHTSGGEHEVVDNVHTP